MLLSLFLVHTAINAQNTAILAIVYYSYTKISGSFYYCMNWNNGTEGWCLSLYIQKTHSFHLIPKQCLELWQSHSIQKAFGIMEMGLFHKQNAINILHFVSFQWKSRDLTISTRMSYHGNLQPDREHVRSIVSLLYDLPCWCPGRKSFKTCLFWLTFCFSTAFFTKILKQFRK
jgi:hypothetical protein